MDLCITAQEPFAYSLPTSKPFTAVAPPTPGPASGQSLSFDLVIHDPASDSSLTHPWDLPLQPLVISLDTTKAQLLHLLRDQLPNAAPRTRHRPKLQAVTLYWTFRGLIIPLGLSDADWHFRNPITKTEMLGRSEMEWYLLKEMMASSGGALKCYLAIRGEAPSGAKRTAYARWFRTG